MKLFQDLFKFETIVGLSHFETIADISHFKTITGLSHFETIARLSHLRLLKDYFILRLLQDYLGLRPMQDHLILRLMRLLQEYLVNNQRSNIWFETIAGLTGCPSKNVLILVVGLEKLSSNGEQLWVLEVERFCHVSRQC